MHFSSYILLVTYKIITALIAPLGVIYLCYRKRKDPSYGLRVLELLGIYFRRRVKSCIWIHGASVGEINALKPFIKEFRRNHIHETIILTTMTTTGAQAAANIEGVEVRYSPLDSPLAVCGFFRKFNPEALIIIDTELWPNILDKAYRKKCPVFIINARMQEKNCNSYLKHATFVKDVIGNRLTKVLCTSYADKTRFEKIGVASENVVVTGNIKYDLRPNDNMFRESRKIKEEYFNTFIFGAISIHEHEEEVIINAFLKAKHKNPNIKMVLVPRHHICTTLACNYLDNLKIRYNKKSELRGLSLFNTDILIGDTMGEIETYFGLCDVVCMGGSFTSIGGHNPLEPAYFGLPLITGPDYHNFQEIFDKMVEEGGCFVAENEEGLMAHIIKLSSNKELLERTGIVAMDIQHQGRGALAKNIEQIDLKLFGVG